MNIWDESAAGFGVLLVFIGLLLIGLILIPGLIANRRNHPYKGVIWALSIFGTFAGGIGWIAALVWALWPQEKSFIDPIVGNTYAQQNIAGSPNTLSFKLAELDRMLATGQVTQAEHEALRKKALGL